MIRIQVQVDDGQGLDQHTLMVTGESGPAAAAAYSFIDAFRDGMLEREKTTYAEQQNRLLKSERPDVVIERNDHEVG